MSDTSHRPETGFARIFVAAVATLFFLVCTWTSYARWADFSYRTFDLAFYVQGIWQFLHGRFQVSVINVPLLGNHVEPIVFLFAPLFAVIRHPMIFVAVQNAALATLAPVGYSIARRLGLGPKPAVLLAVAILIAPAAGYIALHEFHPEAFTALFILLLWRARLVRRLGQHWLWFVALLACKENVALLLVAYCAVQAIAERERGVGELARWYLFPLGVAILWFFVCTKIIAPVLNSGNVDYAALYDRLGSSPREILWNAIAHPQLIGHALSQSLTHGNLFWALLFPFLCLPLLKPRWLLIATPILLQHLLSWRSSEWTIYFHYAAPLLPLFWIALVEAVAVPPFRKPAPALVTRIFPWLVIGACVAAQIAIGPAAAIASATTDWFAAKSDRARKNAFIGQISPNESVVAPLPYLSHLAMRPNLYSLHHILKGLKTLSHESYQPPPASDVLLVDYDDSATFDAGAGYYHPAMQTVDNRIVPSSDRLLHEFLSRARWIVNSSDELTLFRQSEQSVSREAISAAPIFEIGKHTQLTGIKKSGDVISDRQPLEIAFDWNFRGQRDVFPWMLLRLTRLGSKGEMVLTKGLCAPEIADGQSQETWRITSTHGLAAGDYFAEAIFLDNPKRAWSEATGHTTSQSPLLSKPIPLGQIQLRRD